MAITTDSPLYRKAFEQYLRKGTSIEISLKALMTKAAETRDNHSTALYRWRTAGDDKVRPSHAANEGRIFNWDYPPDTGHPGEDYNCRCTAEPVEIDASPLELLALLSGVGIVRTVGVRVAGAILRRIPRSREDPPPPKPAEPPPLPKPEGIPKHWEKIPADKKEGVKYIDPKNRGNDVRIQRGNPTSQYPNQRGDYVRWKKEGQWLDKNGRPSMDPEKTHIPVDEFVFKPEIFK